MNTVKVRKLEIGSGATKICVPVMGEETEEILKGAQAAFEAGADMAEWRADDFKGALCTEQVCCVLKQLREVVGDMPILFTFRTKQEGGKREICKEDYIALNLAVIRDGIADLVDAELFMGEDVIEALRREAGKHKVRLVLSNHDFEKTPSGEEIVERLCRMQKFGADIAKIAVMPKGQADVKTLLDATWEMKTRHTDTPVITMSMGKTGAASRLLGGLYGSSVTFACAERASAPGQIEAEKMREILKILEG